MTVCLNMIVRNESGVVKRCFDSVLPLINYWVIVDTGSTDGTQEVIRNYFKEKGIPGELHERPWIDFATDRNFALELAQGKADYLLFIDADEILLFHPGFKPMKLEADAYYIVAESAGNAFIRMLMVKSGLNWKWEGVVHEGVISDAIRAMPVHYKDVSLVSFPDGARRLSPKKFHNDVEMLRKAYKKDPENLRLLFFLCRSLLANRQFKSAIYHYKKHIRAAPNGEGSFLCYLDLGTLYCLLRRPESSIVKIYEAAAACSSTRVEPYYQLANYFRHKKEYEKAFEFAQKGVDKPMTQKGTSLDKWLYQHGMQLEYMLAAYATGHPELGKQAAETILKRTDITQNIRNLVDRTFRALERGDMSPLETVK